MGMRILVVVVGKIGDKRIMYNQESEKGRIMVIKEKVIKILSFDILERKLKGDLLCSYLREKKHLKLVYKCSGYNELKDDLRMCLIWMFLLYGIPVSLFHFICIARGFSNGQLYDFEFKFTEIGELLYSIFRYSGYTGGAVVVLATILGIFSSSSELEFICKFINYIKSRHKFSKKYRRSLKELNKENKENLKIDLSKKSKIDISK